jgi:sirohydrochlorin ferrochelatase
LIELKKALLLIDRGSREPEVRDELSEICSAVKDRGQYDYCDYCFLEVVPPYIEEGIRNCVKSGSVFITIVPYFLYPGLKLKETVKQSAIICKDQKLRIGISKPLCYHDLLTEIIVKRISETKTQHHISLKNSDCDILIIGHGSSDKSAREAFLYTVRRIGPYYRSVSFSFLELDEPGIGTAIVNVVSQRPKNLIIVPYFLHKGAHIKHDVSKEVRLALDRVSFDNAFISRHLGVDEKLIQLILHRAKEVESRSGIR